MDGVAHVSPLLHKEATNISSTPTVIITWQVVQYIEMFKRANENDDSSHERSTSDSFAYASDYLSNPYYFDTTFSGGFHKDVVNGHGTWTASIAAGAVSARSPVTEEDCHFDELPGCAGGCITASEVAQRLDNGFFDVDLFCPMYLCDGEADSNYSYCLSDDPVETLYHNSGGAPGAQIAMFDASYSAFDLFPELAGNLLWESAMNTGAKIHSNSWGEPTFCELTELEYLYDTFMYEVRQ